MNPERRVLANMSHDEEKERPMIGDLPELGIQPVVPDGSRKKEVPIERTISPENVDEILNGNNTPEEEKPN